MQASVAQVRDGMPAEAVAVRPMLTGVVFNGLSLAFRGLFRKRRSPASQYRADRPVEPQSPINLQRVCGRVQTATRVVGESRASHNQMKKKDNNAVQTRSSSVREQDIHR
jgi:hypothetical protein